MAKKNKNIDITKTGPIGYKELQKANNLPYSPIDDEIAKMSNMVQQAGSQSNPYRDMAQPVQSSLSNTTTPWGSSMFDVNTATEEEFQNLGDIRAENQPWYAKIGAGVAKGAVIAGTTFTDGIAGTLVGIGNVIANKDDINSVEDGVDKFINNPFSVALQRINDWSESVLPNYYTEHEMSSPWWENIATANFIGDKFLKNLGFTIGAAYSGRVAAGIMGRAMGLNKVRDAFKGVVTTASGRALNTSAEIAKAYKAGDAFIDGVKITNDLAKSAKRLKNAEYGLRTLGAVNAAMGEGRIEAITGSKEYYDYNAKLLGDRLSDSEQVIKQQLMREHPEYFSLVDSGDGTYSMALTDSRGKEELQRKMEPVRKLYEDSMAKLNADRAKMANRIFAANVALLSGTNLFTYGRFLSGGYNTGRKGAGLLKFTEEGAVVNKGAITKKYARAGLVPFAEMNEEMVQAAIQETTGQKYASELNSFYGARINPDAEEQTIDWMEAVAKGIANTYGSPDRWEEGFLGLLTGGMGMPHISMKVNESGKRRPKLSIEGELWDGIKEASNLSKEATNLADALNARLKDPEFKNYYQGLIRHNKFQNDMEAALNRGDNFSFKNADHSQFISDAMLFDKAGRLQDLYNIIEEAGNVTIDDVDDIRQEATKKDGTESIFDSMTDEQVIDHIHKQQQNAKNKLDAYVQISNDLKTLYGENVSSDTMEELTWMMTQIDDWEQRTKSLIGSIKEDISSKSKEIFDRFGIDISAELGNLESMLSQVEKPDNVIDQINRIIRDKNISIEEGRQRIKEAIKARNIERSLSGLELGRKIQKIKKEAREKREALQKQFSAEEENLSRVREYNEEDKKKLYQSYLQELERLTSELAEFYEGDDRYSNLRVDGARVAAVDAFERYASLTNDMDAALSYAEESLLNRMVSELAPLEGKRGESAYEKAKIAEARQEQKALSERLLDEILNLEESLTGEFGLIDPLNVKQLGESFMDLIKLYAARAEFIEKYTNLSENPELFTEENQKYMQQVLNHIKDKEVNDVLDNIKDIDTVSGLIEFLSNIDDSIVEEVLDKFSKSGDREASLVEELNKMRDYMKSLGEVLRAAPPEVSGLTESLMNIINDAFNNSNSLEEMKDTLEEAKKEIPEEITDALTIVMKKAEKNNKSRKSAQSKDKNKPKQPVKKSRGFSLSDAPDSPQQDTGMEEDEDEKPTKKSSPKSSNSKVQELEDKSTEGLEEIVEGKRDVDVPQEDKPKVQKLAKEIVKNRSIPDGDGQAEGTNSEDNNPAANQQSITSYLRSWYHSKYKFAELKSRGVRRAERYDSPVVDALDELGAFDFVDEGNLGVLFNNDNKIKIHYVSIADSRLAGVVVLAIEVTSEVESLVKIPHPFIAQNGKKYQAVGALGFNSKNKTSVDAYNRIVDKFDNEITEFYEDGNHEDVKIFVSEKYYNEIQHLYSGRMVKTIDHNSPRQRPLREVVSGVPVLGVYYGDSPTPRVPMLGSEEEIVPLNSNNANPREGSVWLMTREADGRWYSKAVQVKRFTTKEYDIDEHLNTPIMQSILEDLRTLADPSKDDYDRYIAKYSLMNTLYFPEEVDIWFEGDIINIKGLGRDIGSGLDVEEKVQALLEALQDETLNLRFQVDTSALSEKLYINDLLKSDILTTDLAIPHNVNASFDLKIPDSEGKPIDSKTNPVGHTGHKGVNNSISAITLTLNGDRYSIENGVIKDSNGDDVIDESVKGELRLLYKIREGQVNPVEGSLELYTGVYTDTGEVFGISRGYVVRGEKLKKLLQDAKKKSMAIKRKQNLNNAAKQIDQNPESQDDSILGRFSSRRRQNPPKNTSDFNVGDRVSYKTSNASGTGEVIRITNKMVFIKQDDGKERGYTPLLLTKIDDNNEGSDSSNTDDNTTQSFGLFIDATDDEKETITGLGYDLDSEDNNGEDNDNSTDTILPKKSKKKVISPLNDIDEDSETTPKSSPKAKKKPLSLSDTFEDTPTQTPSSKDTSNIKKLIFKSMERIVELGFNDMTSFIDYVNDPDNKLPSLDTITDESKMNELLDIIEKCRA